MNRSAGYTLIEVLIMLAVTAILAATVLETVRASASNGLRIEQAARNASQDYITLAGVRRAVENTRADYTLGAGPFQGDETHFSALTTFPVTSSQLGAQPYTLRLINDRNSATLVYESRSGDLTAAVWPNAQGRFSYYGPRTEPQIGFTTRMGEPTPREWNPQWPPQTGLSTPSQASYFRALPLAVRAEIDLSDDETHVIVFHLPATAAPDPRIEDVIGNLLQ